MQIRVRFQHCYKTDTKCIPMLRATDKDYDQLTIFQPGKLSCFFMQVSVTAFKFTATTIN